MALQKAPFSVSSITFRSCIGHRKTATITTTTYLPVQLGGPDDHVEMIGEG